MKKIDMKDLAGAALSAGVGILTYMIYQVGKSAGKIDAYTDCSNLLNGLVEDCAKIKPNE